MAAALRTLVISDLHLGNRAGNDVLRLPAPRARLLEALAGIDRLVLLGDTLDLMARHPRRSMAAAEPVLRAIGRELGPDRELVLVPGNHDAPLIRSWVNAQGAGLRRESDVPPQASPALARLLSWLDPARTRVSYPGVWLEDRMWATHGHYLDRHLLPVSAFGLPRRPLGGSASAPTEYERALRSGHRSRDSLASRLATRPVGTLLESTAGVIRTGTMRRVPQLLKTARLTPVTAGLIDLQMRHASLPALGTVATRLGVDADWVIFGHVHRRGPLAGEDWTDGSGVRLLNTGSWLFEPVLVDRASPPHPYWPGGAVLVEPGRAPRSLGLLDELDTSLLRPPGRRRRH
ncbi:MAG: metallophosphoesterase [Solirubrobacteraceae bacterium]